MPIHRTKIILGRTLFLRSQRVALKVVFVLPLGAVVFSIAFGLTRCSFFTALERESTSSSSSSPVASGARDLKLNRRQIFLALPSPTFFTSCLRSQPRGILERGSEPVSRKAASVSSHVWLNAGPVVVGAARLRGDGTMAATVSKNCLQ